MSQGGELTVRLSLDDREYLYELGRAVRKSEREFEEMARSVAQAEAQRERAAADAARRQDQRMRSINKLTRTALLGAAAAASVVFKTIGDAAAANPAVKEWADDVADSVNNLSVAVGTDLARAFSTVPIQQFVGGLEKARTAAVDFLANVGRQVTFGVFDGLAGDESLAALKKAEAAEQNVLRQGRGNELFRELDGRLTVEAGGAAADAARSAMQVEAFFKAVAEAQKAGLDSDRAIALRERAKEQAEAARAKVAAAADSASAEAIMEARRQIAQAKAQGENGTGFAEEAAYLQRGIGLSRAQRAFDASGGTENDRAVLDARKAAIQAQYEAEIRLIRKAHAEEVMRENEAKANDRDRIQALLQTLEIEDLRRTGQKELARQKEVELEYERRIAEVRASGLSDAEKADAIARLQGFRASALTGGGGSGSSAAVSAASLSQFGGRLLGAGVTAGSRSAELSEAQKQTRLLEEIAREMREGGGGVAVYG